MKFSQYRKRLNELALHNPGAYFQDDDVFRAEISSLITEARVHFGLTQEKLAKLIGTQQPSIARIESGAVLPSIQLLKRIADSLNTHVVIKFGFSINTSSESGSVLITHESENARIENPIPTPYYNIYNEYEKNSWN